MLQIIPEDGLERIKKAISEKSHSDLIDMKLVLQERLKVLQEKLKRETKWYDEYFGFIKDAIKLIENRLDERGN